MKRKFAVVIAVGLLVIGAVLAAPEWSEPTSVVEVKDRTGQIVATVTLVNGSKIMIHGSAQQIDQPGNRLRTSLIPGAEVRVVSANGGELFAISTGTNSSVEYNATAISK